MEEYINIFVYGSLKRGFHNHKHYCKNMIRCENATFKGTLFDTGYGFPALDIRGNTKIYGQLITVPKSDLKYFDALQGVPRLYQRKQVEVLCNNKTEKAFVYHMDCSRYKFKVVPSGNWS